MTKTTALSFSASCTALLAAIYGAPALIAWLPVRLLPSSLSLVGVFLAPFVYALVMPVTAGLLSRPFCSGILAGKFPRDVSHPVYRKRRYFGLCWTALYYCKPVYSLCLTLPWLKWITFRLFGYRGQMDFTVYPDTWIRDLPLLDLGKGVYIANRATLGTNMPLKNGKILVEGIRIGARSLVGHLTMLAAGVELGEDARLESGCALGIFVKVGSRSSIGGTTAVDHYAQIGKDVTVGASSYLANRSRLPDGTVVPAFSTWVRQAGAPAALEPELRGSVSVRGLAPLRAQGVRRPRERQDPGYSEGQRQQQLAQRVLERNLRPRPSHDAGSFGVAKTD